MDNSFILQHMRIFILKIFNLFIILFGLSSLAHGSNDGSRYTENSVLAKGNWYKIKIPSTGVYKLTYEDLKKMGLSNPKNVKVYGYGGWILDEDFRKPYVDDLPAVGIWMSKSPENFGSGDYILFYGQGDIKWTYNKSTNEFIQTQNPYSSDNYYFVTESNEAPNIITSRTALPTGDGVEISKFQDYYLHEKELVNVSQSGRDFFGEDFRLKNEQAFTPNLAGVTNDPATFSYNFVSKVSPGKTASLSFTLNNKEISKKTISGVSASSYYVNAEAASDKIILDNLSETNTVSIKFTPGTTSTDKNVHLDYFRINYTRNLQPYGSVTSFRSTNLIENINFNISNVSSNMFVLDVTDPINPTKIDGQISGNTLKFNASNSNISEYVLINPTLSIPTPEIVGKISNQNLHAFDFTEMVIIVQPFFKKYAEELAQIHKDDSGLKSIVVTPEDIFNEFSSGKPDATAYRRFMKMFYDRATSDSDKPRYLLLFGDGSYDNRFVTSQWAKEEKRGILLTYESTASLNESNSYTTDDYFGFLDDNDGVNLNTAKLNIGIGRLPVRTTQEASAAVHKIRRYMANEEPGIWQNNVTFIADDAIAGSSSSSDGEKAHMYDSDSYTEYIKHNHPEFTISKIYEDMYERVITANGARYPDAQKAMLDKIHAGTLVLGYSGHGSTNDWTHEYILTSKDVNNMTNSKLALWVTATCDFGRFDGDLTSGGELAFLNPNGGAIALLTTTRIVYISQNKTLNTALYKHVLTKDENGLPLRIGDIVRETKLDPDLASDGGNKLRFTLLGDPALRLNYPGKSYNVQVETINDKEISDEDVEIQALSNVVIKGIISDIDQNLASDFTGSLEAIVYDSEQDLKTRGYTKSSNNATDPSISLDYKDYPNTIFSGKVDIIDGEFEISFVAPKDILYANGKGKMSFFAASSDNVDFAQGAFTNYIVGGTNPNAQPESTPPSIDKIYLNREDFKSGGKVNNTPYFYAEVSDDTGINLAGAIGHNMSITIDGKTSYDLTSSFKNTGSSTKSGSVSYLLPELSEGSHNLQFRVWDVWNNSAYHNLDFVVSENYKPAIYDFKLEKNPTRDFTIFNFSCDVPGSIINIKYAVYSINGGLVWSHEERGSSTELSNYQYQWNLESNNGTRISSGVYICRVLISINGEESTKSEKLIVLEQ